MSGRYGAGDLTWGFEAEWGDVDRRLRLPDHLGRWDTSETCVVNLREPYRHVASDPLGLDPPVGGEINLRPTSSWPELVERILELRQFFEDAGCPPTLCCLSHNHVHVGVPGLMSDVEGLRGLLRYVRDNQALVVDWAYDLESVPRLPEHPGAGAYMRQNGGRLIPEHVFPCALAGAESLVAIDECLRRSKSGGRLPRRRYAINLAVLSVLGTVEFRCFRGSVERIELESCFRLVEAVMGAALSGGPGVMELRALLGEELRFPRFWWSAEEYEGWVKTRYDRFRGQKVRHDWGGVI